IVVDPVMVATSGAKLLRDDAVETLKARLFPLAEVLTPNIPEAEILSGMTIRSAAEMEAAGRAIGEAYGCAVLCKGGHQINDADDYLFSGGAGRWFRGRRIDNPNTHGTGCTLSSAIAANLAKGMDLEQAVEQAKAYISGALAAMLDLGRGSGPMDHMFDLRSEFIGEVRK
ncbi:MAG: hydroxymethylpyrimidine/phosphomethylpyrimidine kinase, partial [Oscillospiraceae bacterium]